MNRAALNILLAILLFVTAYMTFDWHDRTQLTISTVLFLSGLHSLFTDAESEKMRVFARSCLRIAALLSVLLIVKLLIFG
jgi:hypothetical protein